MRKRSQGELWEASELVACGCPLSPPAAADRFGFMTMPHTLVGAGLGSGDRPGHAATCVLSPATPDATNAAPKACFCLLVVFTCSPASGCLRTSFADWLENSSMLLKKKKIINRYSKISRYSAPLQRAPVSHQLSAQSSSKSCYIISQLQDFSSVA